MARDLLEVNQAFYRAMRQGDLHTMDALWSTQRNVTCTHPGWPLLSGRRAVMDSWEAILTQQKPLDIWPSDPMPIITGSTAIVVCTERLGAAELSASNAYALENGIWRIINHQATQVPISKAQ